MELTGETVLNATPERVRSLLHDRGVLGRLLPASRDLVPTGPGSFEGVLVIGGPQLGQRYPVRATVEEQGDRVLLVVSGTGRAEGMWVRADCGVTPGAMPGTTRLTWRLAAELGALGRWIGAAAGQRLLAGFVDGVRRELGTA